MTELGDRLIAHYVELLEGRWPRDDNAWGEARDLVRADPHGGWALITEVLERIPMKALTYLAAGPLEDLIDFHPDFAVTQLEAQPPDERLSRALRGVIVGPWVAPSTVSRLRRLVPETRYAKDP